MSDTAKNITELKWNAYSAPVTFACVGDIEIETIPCEPLQRKVKKQKKQSIQVIYRKKGENVKTLNIPQNISSFYPVILQDKPRIVLHGHFNADTGDCYYIIAVRFLKKHKSEEEQQAIATQQVAKKKKSKLATFFNVSTLYLFKDMKSIGKKVSRVAYKPMSMSSSVAHDMKQVKPLLSFPDYERDQAFLNQFTDEQSQKLTRMYTWIAALFIFVPYPYLWYFDLYGKGMGYFFIGIMYFIALVAVRARYEAKYRKRTKVFEFLWKLITWRFM